MLDAAALAAYRRRVAELDLELDAADLAWRRRASPERAGRECRWLSWQSCARAAGLGRPDPSYVDPRPSERG